MSNGGGSRFVGRSWAEAANLGAASTGNQNTPGRSHWRQRSLLVNGVSNDSTADKSFAADICLVAGGVSKNANTDKLRDYLKNKGLNIVACELLTTRVDQARTLSFKVTIKAEDFEKAKDPNIWPYRVVVRKFVNFRKREIDEFAPQLSQVGGVHPLSYEHGQAQLGGQRRGPQGVQRQEQVENDVTAVKNRFDVPGFRESVSHSTSEHRGHQYTILCIFL